MDFLGNAWRRFSEAGGIEKIGVAITAAGTIYTIVRQLGIGSWVVEQVTVSVEVTSRDDAFHWVKRWLDDKLVHCHVQHISAEVQLQQLEDEMDDARAYRFVPAVGVHWVEHNGRRIRVKRERSAHMQDLNSGVAAESITLLAVGRNVDYFPRMLRELRAAAVAATEGKTRIFLSDGSSWDRRGLLRSIRPLSSVILAGGLADALSRDMTTFITRGQWYRDRGIPWRRGYLVYGPPGGGKTSLVRALAGALRRDICVVALSDPELTDVCLSNLLNTARGGAIVLLEDIDTVCAAAVGGPDGGDDAPVVSAAVDAAVAGGGGGEEAEPDGPTSPLDVPPGVELRSSALRQLHAPSDSALTLGGLLNALDGVAAQEGRVVIMTSNHPQRLAAALLRPGRIDVAVRLGRATVPQTVTFVERFYGLAHTSRETAALHEWAASVTKVTGADAAVVHAPQMATGAVVPTMPVSAYGSAATLGMSGRLSLTAPAGELPFSMATLQGHCVSHDSPAEAIAQLHTLMDRRFVK